MIDDLARNKQSGAASDALAIVLTGDVILDVPEPDHWLGGIAPAVRAADIAIGHLEVPHTARSFELAGDVPAPGADPAHLAALKRAGFAAMTLAGNHIADCGPAGIADTIEGLNALGIASCGAGADLVTARRPVLLEHGNRRLAVLSYNCVGPQNAWAGEASAGCAYLPVATADGTPITPPKTLTTPTAEAAHILTQDIAAVRDQAELVIVALHKGIVHTPVTVAPYERQLAHMAIDAGADVVISHHAHIIRGIEFYRGKPVFHGLGNGCVVTHALDPNQSHAGRADWARRRKQLFGFEPDPAYQLAPFHPQAVNAFLARLVWHADGRLEVGVLPACVDAPGRPRLVTGAEAESVCQYLERITREAGLGQLTLQPRDDMVVVG
ncbi:MAG: CapA family protein [Gammaproteobacteria bacterium]|nr:CapA family protein [Gammaproteobacteria bacterium]